MKRRREKIPTCSVLVGWDGPKLLEPKTCGLLASREHTTYKLLVCNHHVGENMRKGLTLVDPSEGMPMIGIGARSKFERRTS